MAMDSWLNGLSGDWTVASNWSTGTVPGAADDAILGAPIAPPGGPIAPQGGPIAPQGEPIAPQGGPIPPQGGLIALQSGSGYTVTVDTDAIVNSLTIVATATLDITGSLHILGPVTGTGTIAISGGALDLGADYAGTVTFTGPGGTFVGDQGNHFLAGDDEGNTLDYSAATTGVQFDFSAGVAYNNFGGPTVSFDQFSNIEVFKGGSGNDTYIGGPGNHVIIGGSGINTLDYSAATTGVQFDFSAGVAYNNFGGPTVSSDQFSNIEMFKGGSGNDTYIGGPGNHFIIGGSGLNTLDYSAATTGVQFDLGTGMAYNNFGGPAVSSDQFSNIEVFKGGSGQNDFRASNAPGTYSFIGGGSSDTFSFSGNFGNGTIANFTSGPDSINLDHNQFADFAAVQAQAQQVGNDTVITLDANDTITLQNTMLSNLHAGDFIFL